MTGWIKYCRNIFVWYWDVSKVLISFTSEEMLKSSVKNDKNRKSIYTRDLFQNKKWKPVAEFVIIHVILCVLNQSSNTIIYNHELIYWTVVLV